MIRFQSTTPETVGYYVRELRRRIGHYGRVRVLGYRDHGSLESAATNIIDGRAGAGFRPGGHFRGVWPRDLCFAARGIVSRGYRTELRGVTEWILERFDGTFFTDVQPAYAAATPEEGADTFPALVLLLDAVDRLEDRSAQVATLAASHRDRFFDEGTDLVAEPGSGWWDSAGHPRVAYNTAMLLAALDAIRGTDVETTYDDAYETVRHAWIDRLWTGGWFAERPRSQRLACDANVVPLYFGLVDPPRAQTIASNLESLETDRGIRLRERPFSVAQVHPFFTFHRDYHYHIWPWNSFLYAIGLDRYGFETAATREVERVSRVLGRYGTFLEVYTLAGEPYVKRGYAAAGDFLVAAALWSEFRGRRTRGNQSVDYPLDEHS